MNLFLNVPTYTSVIITTIIILSYFHIIVFLFIAVLHNLINIFYSKYKLNAFLKICFYNITKIKQQI